MTLILSGSDGLSDVDGTAAAPALRGTDTNTGIFFGADIIGFSEGGVESARFNADAQFVAAAGTAALPVITTTGDVNTGIFFPAADTIAFSEGGAEAMRIDSSGNLLVGATSTSFPSSDAKVVASTNAVQTALFASVNAASSTATPGIVIRKYDNNNTTSQLYLHCNYNQGTSGAGGIQGNGAAGIQFYSSSDARLKENIVELEPQLANIMALKPSKFDFIDGPKDCTGFVAQEMETVYPDAIGETPDGYKTIGGISIMETRLIKAIQEMKAIIDTQASTITALTTRITALEAA